MAIANTVTFEIGEQTTQTAGGERVVTIQAKTALRRNLSERAALQVFYVKPGDLNADPDYGYALSVQEAGEGRIFSNSADNMPRAFVAMTGPTGRVRVELQGLEGFPMDLMLAVVMPNGKIVFSPAFALGVA